MTPDDKYIYAVDFDGTISNGEWPKCGPANADLVNYLIRQRLNGNKVILNTNRTGELLDEAIRFCRIGGLEFDAINENLPEMIEAYGSDPRKISADFYIDDNAVNVKDFDWGYLNLHKQNLVKGGKIV